MALSGSVSVEATPNGRDLLVFSWEAVQDAVAKTSTITWVLQLVADASGALNVTNAEIYPWAVTIDGQAFSGKSNIYIQANQTKTLATGSAVLSHDTDGTKSFDFSFMQNFGGLVWGGSTVINDVTGSGVGVLDSFAKKFPLKEWITGIILERLSRFAPPKEPVAYLYGTLAEPLPALPEVEGYRYAVVSVSFREAASVYLSKLPFVAVKGGTMNGAFINKESETQTILRYTCDLGEQSWRQVANEEIPPGDTYLAITLKWSNHDILYEDGTLYLAGTDPVPVYEMEE